MIDKEQIDLFPTDHPLDLMARYHIQSGGKGIRGKIALAEASVLNVPPDKAQRWALACELLHNATLIHDDIQDNDPMRRGQPSVWKKFGINEAINLGDYFFFKAFKVANQLGVPALVDDLSEVAEQLVRGQTNEQLLPTFEGICCWESYLEMTRQKTGALFLLPAIGIHRLSETPMNDNQQQAWLNLGVSYQIYDDIRDYLGLKQKGQKQKDLKEKKVNALIARLSTKGQHDELIATYHSLPTGHPSYRGLIAEIQESVEDARLIKDLEAQARLFLQEFLQNSFEETRKVIFDYIQTATVIKESPHVSQ